MKVLLTGGGSGGHVSPALAVARLLQSSGEHELLYVGGTMTMEGSSGPSIEEKLVKPTGINYVSIPAGKLKRDGLSLTTLKRLWGVIPGMIKAVSVVRNFRPDVVFSSGGYVSLPVVYAAALLRIPIVIHEQTAVVGLANSLASKVATKVAITFPQSADYFPAMKVVVTGNPIRPEVLQPQTSNKSLAAWLDEADKTIIYITGGGLGSHILNTTIESILPEILESYCLVHQCGAHAQYKDFERLEMAAKSLNKDVARRYNPSQYFTPDEVGMIYAKASMAVARSGANTVLELAAVGLPAIFIPIPWVTHDEQTKNAAILAGIGLATILPEKELDGVRLLKELEAMHSRISKLSEAKNSAKSLVDFEADKKLVKVLLSVAESAT